MNQLTHPTNPSRASTPRHRRRIHALLAILLAAPTIAATIPTPSAAAPPGQVGQGFTVTASDLAYILDQIKIAEHHSTTFSAASPCAGLLGQGPDQVPSPLIGLGLRTIDGSCNNLQPGQEHFGAADQTFPRLTAPDFRAAEPGSGAFAGLASAGSSYAQTKGNVFDTQPRLISNLIVDQTSTNPAAIAAAGFPVRAQAAATGVVPCATVPGSDPPVDIDPPTPTGCVPAHQTLFIPNVTTDVGLSPPYNSLFTIFGQFFDHGLDKVTNGGSGTVFVPLRADDPLIAGPDHIRGNADDLPPNLRFMVLTRATAQPGPDGIVGDDPTTPGVDESADDIREGTNTDSPWVDLSQAYTSHPSHQVFLREYVLDAGNHPQSTSRLLSNVDGAMANWADIKAQAQTRLGLLLVDTDVNDIPMIAADPYGNFIPGPNGLPQYVTTTGSVEGNLAAPVAAPANVLRIHTAFLNDIAHSAVPVGAPDADHVAGSSLTPPVCGPNPGDSPCYDDELLDLHVIAGDGRANENIGLTAIHTIFEHEHNRLTVDAQNTLNANPTLLGKYQATNCAIGCTTNDPTLPTTFTYGERMFQAARFVTEMEYQHLVFEEFARKVQPAINPFNLFAFSSTATDPAIKAEFAHAVYRFGHSMLDETIPRTNVDGSTNDIALLDGFLNPAAFKDVTAADLAEAGGDMGGAGAGAIVMGLSDQVGNELDEFVSETLRNNLLGLPLDLASINMTRARSEGIPSLNNVRKQIFAQTNDGQLMPYTNWVDFSSHMKHPESLINFVAAYGTHPTITGQTTIAGKRNAARILIDPTVGDIIPTDADDFMNSTAAWANTSNGVSRTGLDQVDLWVGGLAEITNLFGGLLGTTFNYVFELQMTQLQDNDRLYYLNRTPGMNLRTQLEGNSFAELIMRNTTATGLKADSFGTADCKFILGNLVSPATSGFRTGSNSIQDDPTSECDENELLMKVSGQIRYRSPNKIDPVGINGQSVYNGTPAVDRIGGGNDNDTIRGNEGNDVLEGNGGDDDIFGGLGNDIETDLGGDDVLKGGPGNDALDGGIGLDLLLGGDGKDFTAGGANTNVHFDGPGDDFILAGQGADEVDGDSGSDWLEGGEQTDLLQGDSGTLFFDDHNSPGDDIMIGQAGDDDYDMEGGDDIGVAGPGIEKNAGAAGWDWSIGLSDPQPQDADLALPVIGVPLPINQVRDRFNEVESLSGWNFDDILRGDSVIPSQITGGGFIGCDALDQAGLDRIAGLDTIVPALHGDAATDIIPNTVTRDCPLVGAYWGEGNILLGGAGNDTIEGRGGDDILDGDRYLSVRLSVRSGVDANGEAIGAELGSTDLLEHTALSGDFGAGTVGMTLQQAVFGGLVDPGQIVAVREVLDPGAGTDVDVALFSGPELDYDLTFNDDGSLTVAHTRGAATDGTDILWNIEELSFCDIPGAVRGTCDLRAAVPVIRPEPAAHMTLTIPDAVTTFAALLGGTSATETVTVTNTGNADLVITSVSTFGADVAVFPLTDGCTGTFAPGASCTIGVSFAPITGGITTGFLDIIGNDPNGEALVFLSGETIAPAASITAPAGLTTFSTPVGTTSAAQTVTVTNTGTANLLVSGVSLTGADAASFLITANTCTTGIAPAGACTISVALSPAAAGPRTAQLVIQHNAGADSVVNLAGTGTAPIATVTAPAGVGTFSAVVATTSAAQSVTVTNTGTANLTVAAVTLAGANANQFVVLTNGCVAAVVPAGSCAIGVAFRPTTVGAKMAQLVIQHNAGANSVVNLAGTGVASPSPVMTIPTTLAFGNVRANRTRTLSVTITNRGPGALLIGAPTTTGRFTVTRGNCPASLAVGRSCTLRVTFRPNARGPFTGILTVPSNALNSPHRVTLTGTGT